MANFHMPTRIVCECMDVCVCVWVQESSCQFGHSNIQSGAFVIIAAMHIHMLERDIWPMFGNLQNSNLKYVNKCEVFTNLSSS